ncbi:MAG: class I SAM-dependent methyltransferase [Candidatus Obscuribacterales bacterium]
MSSPNHTYSDQLRALKEHYSERAIEHGDSAPATNWPDRESQERRLEILCSIADLSEASILDFGCGTGHLLTYLREKHCFEGTYTGVDICPEMIEIAGRKFPEDVFECRDILAEPIREKSFDYVMVSGVFNNRVEDNWGMMKEILSGLFPLCRKGLAFNNLSTFVDFFAEDLFYVDPCEVFRFCKENLSPLVSIRHDYLSKPDTVPFEFTTFVYASELKPRQRKG